MKEIKGFENYSIDEKGNRYDDKFFKSEKDAVEFVFEFLVKNGK